MTDPFGTADLRRTVLAAWAASPARFREDANTEEDHARGYYRDRVIVELAQNAADAAVAAGVAGHLSLTLESDADGVVLYARNTGAALTAAGVQALATMRASAKTASQAAPAQTARPSTQAARTRAQPAPDATLVGRFGVGFAAVRAVSDSITITSRPASDAPDAEVDVGVQFDLDRTRQELEATAGAELTQEVADRGADLPILRLPVPATAHRTLPEFTTTVALRLRDDAAVAAVRAQLEAVDELLLLALPGLSRISVPATGSAQTRVVELTEGEWRTVHRSGHLPDSVLTDRPVEERHRSAWSVTWALRTPHASGTDSSQRTNAGGVIHAPTATDEGCGLPATLIATFPLDPSRRHVAPGPVTEEILTHAAAAYLELVQQVAQAGGAALELVPTGLAAGALDASLQEQIRAELPNIPLLPSPLTEDQPQLLRPRDAFTLQGPAANEPKLIAALAEHLPELIWVPANQHPAARTLGVQTRALADVVEELPDTTEQLRNVFMAHIDAPGLVDALADLPVRLLDGRVVRGVRGVVIPDEADDSDGSDSDGSGGLAAFERWGLRVADPQQAHVLWSRLGAGSPAPIALLDSAPVQQAIVHLSEVVDSTAFREDLDPDDDAALTAVLTLIRRAIDDEGTLPTQLNASLAGLPLESVDGELEAARDLTMPGSLADELFDGLLPVAEDEVEQWGTQTLTALGVRTAITVQTRHDVVADAGLDDDAADHSLPDRWPDYVEFLAGHLGEGAYIGEVQVIADLDAVGWEQWGRFLTLVADDAQARAALLTAVRGQTSYAAWWLRTEFNAPFARAGTVGTYLPAVPPEFADVNPRDDDLWTALGAVGDLSQLTPAEWDLIFDQIPDIGADQSLKTALEFWAALAAVAGQRSEQLPDAPDRIVARVGARAVVCAADDVVVSAQPMWTQLPNLPGGALGIVPAPDQETAQLVADFLDVPVLTGDDAVPAADHALVRVVDGGTRQQVDPAVHELLSQGDAGRSETGAAGAARTGGEPASSVATTWQQHVEPFRVDTGQGKRSEVTWWVDIDGVSHATGPDGLACALAQLHDQWRNRHLIAALLRNPDDVAVLTADRAWD